MPTNFKVIDNALPQDDFKEIEQMIMFNLPWFYNQSVAHKETDDKEFYFTHTFYGNQRPMSNSYEKLLPLLNSDVLGVKSLMRVKANLYPRTEKIIHHDKHCDMSFEHRGAILYINANNGLTVLEDGIEIQSVPNRILLFDASKPHNSTTCTDAKCRVNINMNFF